jgi:hypothetical protein
MKKAVVFLLILAIVKSFSGMCFAVDKVAIVTTTVSMNEEEFRSAEEMVAKYGKSRIVHRTWPDNFMNEPDEMVRIVVEIATDLNVKALIINQAVPGTNAAVDKLLEKRDDVFIVYVNPQEKLQDAAERAHVVLQPNDPELGYAIAAEAHKMGAKTIVHYSFPRHMSLPLISKRRDNMKQKCDELGIEFVYATAPDPTGDKRLIGTVLFILEDVPKMVARYGTDTAFFATNCAMQIPLIRAVLDTKAIYPIPCCPSPFDGFPAAIGLEPVYSIAGDVDRVERSSENTKRVIDDTKRILKEKEASGRFSNLPVPIVMMFTIGATEYAMKIIDGEASLDKLDKRLLEKLFSDYAGVEIVTTPLLIDGKEYPNFFLTLMDFITY